MLLSLYYMQYSFYATNAFGLQPILIRIGYPMGIDARYAEPTIMNCLVSLLCQTNHMHLVMMLKEG